MEAQIIEIATAAGRVLLHPAAIGLPLLGVLALATGLAGRVAVLIEDFRYPAPSRPAAEPAHTEAH